MVETSQPDARESTGTRLRTLLDLSAIAAFALPYAQWRYWPFPLSTLLLFLLLGLWSREHRRECGLDLTVRQLGGTLLATVVLSATAAAVMLSVATSAGLVRVTMPFPDVAYPVFQALHEEIFLGYLPLVWLSQRTGRPTLACAGLAAVFAVLHVLMYGLGVHGTWLAWPTVATLFLVGLVRNRLILAADHVGYAWALHVGWNLSFLGGWWYRDGRPLTEPEVFDVFLGHPAILATAAVATGASLLLPTSPPSDAQPNQGESG